MTVQFCPSAASRPLRYLIQESRDALDSSIAHHGEVRPLDRAVDTFGTKAPREAKVVAISVRLADQRKAEFGEALLDAGNHGVDAIMAIAAHQRIDVSGIGRPVGGKQFAATVRGFFVP